MARGKKSVVKETGGVWNFIVRDDSKPEEGKVPNFVFDNILGIFIPDTRSLEIVRLKNMKVTEDNINSISKVHGEKYKIGDEYQEWCSLYGTVGCYPTTLTGALQRIKDIAIKNEISKLTNETDFSKVFEAIQATDKKIADCLKSDVTSKSIELTNKLVKDIQSSMEELERVNKQLKDSIAASEDLMNTIKEQKKKVIKEMAEKVKR